MAIKKKLIHFNSFEDFNAKKLSANAGNTTYTLGVNGAVQSGTPDILYQSIVYIKDSCQQWTHGQLYDGQSAADLIGYGEGEDGIFSSGHFYDGGGDNVVMTIELMDSNIYDAMSGKADKATTLAGYGITDKLFKSLGTQDNIDNTNGWGVYHHNSATSGVPAKYGSIMQWVNPMNYDNAPSSGGWYTQLFSATENGGLYFRTRTNGNAWKPWVQIATADTIPTKTSQLTNDSGFATAEAIAGKADKVAVEVIDLGGGSDNSHNLGTAGFGKVYKIQNGFLSSLTIQDFEDDTTYSNNEHREVLIEFDCGVDDMTLTLPSNIRWANDEAPTFKSSYHYQLSITKWCDVENVNNYYLGVCVGFMI